MIKIILLYLAAINLIAFASFSRDKWKAKRGGRRISEATLLSLAAIGGSFGAWAGMYLFRHKTLHKKFTIGVPVLAMIHIGLLTVGLLVLSDIISPRLLLSYQSIYE